MVFPIPDFHTPSTLILLSYNTERASASCGGNATTAIALRLRFATFGALEIPFGALEIDFLEFSIAFSAFGSCVAYGLALSFSEIVDSGD